jgi:hypothetical protein
MSQVCVTCKGPGRKEGAGDPVAALEVAANPVLSAVAEHIRARDPQAASDVCADCNGTGVLNPAEFETVKSRQRTERQHFALLVLGLLALLALAAWWTSTQFALYG